MNLLEEIHRRLENLKRASQEYQQLISTIDGKKQFKEADVSKLESQIERLKKEAEENQIKANLILREAHDEASSRLKGAKQILDDAHIAKEQAAEEKKSAQLLMNQAQALMAQALQKQKEADNAYNQYEEKRKKLMEAVR